MTPRKETVFPDTPWLLHIWNHNCVSVNKTSVSAEIKYQKRVGKVGAESHSRLRSCWPLIAAGRARVGFYLIVPG